MPDSWDDTKMFYLCWETCYGILQELLNRVVAHNKKMNPDGEKTFLLPMAVAQGSPTHPAYPSGHAINVGAYITTLKVTDTVHRKSSHLNVYLVKCSSR